MRHLGSSQYITEAVSIGDRKAVLHCDVVQFLVIYAWTHPTVFFPTNSMGDKQRAFDTWMKPFLLYPPGMLSRLLICGGYSCGWGRGVVGSLVAGLWRDCRLNVWVVLWLFLH